jgi:hypothetical protein
MTQMTMRSSDRRLDTKKEVLSAAVVRTAADLASSRSHRRAGGNDPD